MTDCSYRSFRFALALAVMSAALAAPAAHAQVVYSNDFETDAAGFDVSNFETLPDGSGGVSTYLGRRTPPSSSAVLTLTGLTPGTSYEVDFDLYLGGTWDGSLVFGPDTFSLMSSSSGQLVNASFRNGFPIGDPTPGQTYSDATPLGGGGLFRSREGADAELDEPIYFFGRGAGNPRLVFTASAATETLTFASVNFEGSTDEFFALDDVTVTAVDTVIIDDVASSEGNGGSTDFVFTVTLSNPAVTAVTIDYATADGTATSPGDYTAETGSLTIPAGSSTATITIAVAGDSLVEGDETFAVNLTGATNATIADAQGLGTIVNDDVVPASADMRIQKTTPSTTFTPGQQVTYTLAAANLGPDTATNVTITDVLPDGATFVSVSGSGAVCTGTTTVVCTIATMTSGATSSIALVVNAGGNAAIANTATIGAASPADPASANNSSTVTITPAALPVAAAVPTASEFGLLLLIAGLAMIAMRTTG